MEVSNKIILDPIIISERYQQVKGLKDTNEKILLKVGTDKSPYRNLTRIFKLTPCLMIHYVTRTEVFLVTSKTTTACASRLGISAEYVAVYG